MPRNYFTEEELEALEKVKLLFSQDLAVITARRLERFSPDIQDTVRSVLQEETSLYAPYTADRIERELRRRRE